RACSELLTYSVSWFIPVLHYLCILVFPLSLICCSTVNSPVFIEQRSPAAISR
ncbi:hypothetical protein ILYODFUR_014423, partial [Ilyodon furcidens]